VSNKLVRFALAGAGGCLLGWLFGEGLLGATRTDEPGRTAAPSLASLPDTPDLPPSTAVQPDVPEIPKLALSDAAPPGVPDAPALPTQREAPPPPEFAKRLERESGQQFGDVRVSLLWNNFNDLDLHLIDPADEHIFFQHRKSASGGELDVDENVQPTTDEPVENVYWPRGGAPDGRYRIFVVHYEHHARSPNRTPFQVNALIEGRQQTFEGVISHGDEPQLVHEFTLGPKIEVAVPNRIEVNGGGTNRLPIRLARRRYAGPVTIQVDGASPIGIRRGTVAAGVEEGEIDVAAGSAAVGEHAVKIVASGGGARGEAAFVVAVLPPVSPLSLAAPPRVEVVPGGENRLVVRIARAGLDGPVTVRPAGVLDGVTIDTVVIASADDGAELVLSARDDAAPGERTVELEATAGSARVATTFTAAVLAPPSVFRLVAPPRVEVNPGHENRLVVRVARAGHDGPVTIRGTASPDGVTLAKTVIPAGEDRAELTLVAAHDAAVGERAIELEATAGTDRATTRFEVAVLEAVPAPAVWSWWLILLIGLWTALLTIGLAVALVAIQNQHLRRPLLDPSGVALAVGGGGLVGLVSGGTGQSLLMAFTAAGVWPMLGFVLGWLLLGGLVGFGLAQFIPNLDRGKATLAGALGGLVGSVAFALTTSVGGDVAGRGVGAVILGACIGLMVAFVELAFRRAWLEVRYGGSEVFTVNLGPEPIKVGSDARRCAVYARNSAPVACRFWLDHGKVFCEDVAASRTAEIVPGDSRAVGAVSLTVRTSAGDAPTGSVQQVRKAPPPPPTPSATKSSTTRPATSGPKPVHVEPSAARPQGRSAPPAPVERATPIAPPPPPPPPPPPR
jgi:hypothetical protein